ncbi:helix-turn-helix domain-containing protein [Gallibacterium anatis]|uniref:helix-turn-helix domain-containing protein n=1 Tax=Gallibacterium anatis TaxID=750 RepID=UPI000531F1DB|nr:helix-turn-helix transcriptional regulator [Gallibacterium anatis]KGQ42641.1 XRE family transcriptional regulator [Gallibacterium anatis]KGQ61335.1 XRE family transcriptional regulator [Gallibacterium anatis 7990]
MAQPLASKIDRLVGQRIQKKRRELGFTAEKLSEYVNLTQPQLSRYERGTNKINIAHLVAIATFLKTPINYFFQDCMENFDWDGDEANRVWISLTQTQKNIVVQLIKELRKE